MKHQSKLKEMNERLKDKRQLLKNVEYDPQVENEFFDVVKESIYRQINKETNKFTTLTH